MSKSRLYRPSSESKPEDYSMAIMAPTVINCVMSEIISAIKITEYNEALVIFLSHEIFAKYLDDLYFKLVELDPIEVKLSKADVIEHGIIYTTFRSVDVRVVKSNVTDSGILNKLIPLLN